jgi:pectate lyase
MKKHILTILLSIVCAGVSVSSAQAKGHNRGHSSSGHSSGGHSMSGGHSGHGSKGGSGGSNATVTEAISLISDLINR